MMKSKGETGIVKTLPNKDLVELNTQITAQRLMQNGIDPTQLKNADQVENAIIAIESKPKTGGITSAKSAKVFDMEGKEIDPKKGIMGGKQVDDDLPPPGSRGGKDDIAAPVQSEDEILEKLEKENREARRNLQIKLSKDKGYQKFKGETEEEIRKRFGLDDPEDFAQGGRAGFSNGGIDVLKIEDKALQRALNAFKYYQSMGGKKNFRDYIRESGRFGDQFRAEGGRIGFKDGMTRRTFLKLLGGMTAVPILGKFFKLAKIGKTVTKVPMIKTDDVAGKPEWFDALVNKVITEGDDVTKKFATGERQSIHQKTLDDGSVVRVTEDVDDGAVRVEYQSEKNVFGDDVQLQYKKPLPDEGDPRPTAEFTTAESGPVGRAYGPDDFEIDVDEVGGASIRDLDSDVSKLKEYATGQKPTMKEIVQNKKRQDKARAISEDAEAQSDAVIRRQGDYDPSPDDFASGGIARLLGE